MRFSYKEYVAVFKALSDETRIKIVELLCGGEFCSRMLLEYFEITQPTLSYHLRCLMESGLVVGRKTGSWVYYSINPEKAAIVRCFLEDIGEEGARALFEPEQESRVK